MRKVTNPAEVRKVIAASRREGARIGFVPTMGALHEGHASLVRLAREESDFTVVSIFVNPKQFGPREDLAAYPRDVEADARLLEELGCDLLFVPGDRDLYSPADRTRIHCEGLSEVLCGASRPGHFDGVLLVVAKLFNIVGPDVAFFGQKDAQQAVVIQRMAADLDFPLTVRIGPTVREPDGVAMSSRNAYLDSGERRRAAALFRALLEGRKMIEEGHRSPAEIETRMAGLMEGAGIGVDYASVVRAETLVPWDGGDGRLLVAVAGRLGRARLIDNVALELRRGSVTEILLEFPEWSRYGG